MLIAGLSEGSVPLSVQYSGRHRFHWKLKMLKTELAAAGSTGKIQFGSLPGAIAQVIILACAAVSALLLPLAATAAWLLPAVNTVAPATARAMPPAIRFLNPVTVLSPSARPPRKLRFLAARFLAEYVTNHHRYARELSGRHTMPSCLKLIMELGPGRVIS